MAQVRVALTDAQQSRFPPVCVRTGEDASTTVKVDAFRTPAWAYLLYLLGVLPGVIGVPLVRSRYPQVRRMELPVTDRIAAQRRDRTALALSSTVGGLVLIAVGALKDVNLAVGVGLFLSLAALALTVLALNVPGVTATVTEDDDVSLNHVHERFAAAVDASYVSRA